MNHGQTRRATAGVAVAIGFAAVTGLGTPAAGAYSPAATTAPVVAVTVSNHAVKVSGGTTLQPGPMIFDVTAKGHGHTLQIVRLHKGYSEKRFRKDVKNGVDQGNNVHAIRRLDHRVTWLGGTSAHKDKSRQFGVTLAPGMYLAKALDGKAVAKLTVTGTPQPGAIPTSATVTGTGTDKWKAPKTLPADGWVKLRNTSSEAHFFALAKVKKHTTRKDVRKYIKAGAGHTPAWIARPQRHLDSGVFSRNTDVELHVHLPAGKYLLACFWPSAKNGMPHFAMGMWKLVNLK
jgi:hypothetical protein